MRLIACLICLLPSALLAETIETTSRLTEVTIFASGAKLGRDVTVEGKAGAYDVVVSGLPYSSDILDSLRVLPGDGVTVGAVSISATDKAFLTPLQQKAMDRVKTLEADEREALGKIEEIKAVIAAGEAKATFLQTLGAGRLDLGSSTAESLKAIADMAGEGVLAARQSNLAAQADLLVAQAKLTEVQTALDAARTRRDDLAPDNEEWPLLRLSVTKASDAPATIRVSMFDDRAAWQPSYDANLNRKAGTLTLDRGILVQQQTGEDWVGVHLTLSTARLGGQSDPARLWPDGRRIEPEQPPEAASEDMASMGEPLIEPEVVVQETGGMMLAVPSVQGDTVVYDYPTPVAVASDIERVQLSLDKLTFTPKISAVAVPRRDDTAFLLAKLTNNSDEILLPGSVNLMRDGVLVGTGQIDLLAPGVETELGFGPIEGLRLTRRMPERAEGERGILTSSNQIEEKATLKIENKTGESWPVRLLDQVPYSEQEDLKISWAADPAPTETDVDGERGILAWEFDLEAGAAKEIQLNHTISWPQGMVLQ